MKAEVINNHSNFPKATKHKIKISKGNQTKIRLPKKIKAIKLKFMIKIRDCRQITFITLNRFCLLSVNPSTPLFLTKNISLYIKQVGWNIPSKIK